MICSRLSLSPANSLPPDKHSAGKAHFAPPNAKLNPDSFILNEKKWKTADNLDLVWGEEGRATEKKI